MVRGGGGGFYLLRIHRTSTRNARSLHLFGNPVRRRPMLRTSCQLKAIYVKCLNNLPTGPIEVSFILSKLRGARAKPLTFQRR